MSGIDRIEPVSGCCLVAAFCPHANCVKCCGQCPLGEFRKHRRRPCLALTTPLSLQDAADAAELEALLPQLIAARSHVDDARALLRKGEDLVAGVATSAPSPAASNGSALQQREPQHGDTLHIPKLGIREFIGVSPELSAGAIRSAARKTVEVLPGLRSAQLAAKDMLESITEIQADSGPIVERIKSLHALQLAARETLERVQDLSDLKACLADLSEAMHQHQFEDAAMSIKQFRALENKLHVDESDL